MNPLYFGDSYDLVKRFFCAELTTLGYAVFVDPMFTGNWAGAEDEFYKLVGAAPTAPSPHSGRLALLVDPDTGVHGKPSSRHVSTSQLAELTKKHELVVAFDQSFSRQAKYPEALHSKLHAFAAFGVHAMYYDSHARFVFASSASAPIQELHGHLRALGLPDSRLVRVSSNPSIEATD